MMGTVALYMRLSSEDVREGESASIANQRDLLYDFIRSHEEFDNCCILEFCDDGYSGTNFDRPGVQKLLSLAGKTIDCIIVKDVSRFGRNLIEVGDYLDQIFPFLGVRFIAVNEGYDSGRGNGSSVSLDVSLKAMIYEMYSQDISEKINSVKQMKMQKGEYMGTIAFYGYRWSKTVKNRLEVDPAAAEVVRRIFCMAAEGMSAPKIAVELNREGIPSPLMYRKANHTDGMRVWKTAGDVIYWSKEAVRRIVCDERYTGCMIGHRRTVAGIARKQTKRVPKEKWIVVEDTHEAIVPKDTFAKVQAGLKYKPLKKPRRACHKFSGRIKCAYCTRSLERIACKHPYFICPTSRNVPDHICSNIHLDERILEEVLLAAIQAQVQFLTDSVPETGKDDLACIQEKIKSCQIVLHRYKALQTNAFENYAEGHIRKEEYLSRKQGIIQQRKEAEKRLLEMTGLLVQARDRQKETSVDCGRYAFVKEWTSEMLLELVKEIRVREKDTLELRWNFREQQY